MTAMTAQCDDTDMGKPEKKSKSNQCAYTKCSS